MSDHQHGMTLIEILIVLGLLTSIILLISFFGLQIANFGIFFNSGLEVQQEMQLTFQAMTFEIQSMQQSVKGAYPIAAASANSFTFYSDIDNDNRTDQIRYFLENNTLKKGVVKPSGTPLSYNQTNEVITEVIHYVTGPAAIFTYYDQSYTGSELPMTYPVDNSKIRVVGITVTADKDPNAEPGPVTHQIFLDIRNLRSNI